MTLFERIENKIFFRIVRYITFFVAFIALIVTIAGIYTSVNTSMKIESESIQVAKDEIDNVLKVDPKSSSSEKQKNNTEVKEDPEIEKMKKLAESFAKKFLVSRDIKPGHLNYNEILGKTTDKVLGTLSDFDNKTKIDALKQLDSLSNGFKKDKFTDETNVFLALYKTKYAHERTLVEQKNIANQANKMMGYGAIGGGIVVFALFVMILVLLRIEKNTRPLDSQNDKYDNTDKKLLIGIILVGVLIASLVAWGVNKSFYEDQNFDPVSEIKNSFVPFTQEQPVQDYTPEANTTEANLTKTNLYQSDNYNKKDLLMKEVRNNNNLLTSYEELKNLSHEFSEADHLLNREYTALRKRLTHAEKEYLKKEQLQWMKMRDQRVISASYSGWDNFITTLVDETKKRQFELSEK